MRRAHTAILKTLCYSDVFSYPLTRAQLWHYLPEKGISYGEFSKSLEVLIRQKRIIHRGGYFALYSSAASITNRLETEILAPAKIVKAKKVARILDYIPSVELVGISGSLALRSAKSNDDIDLFIITSANFLWTTRLLCTLLLDMVGLRRRPGEKAVKDKICINMFLSSSDLSLKERNVYTAHEIVQMVPILNKKMMYEHFMVANKWIVKYLPHTTIPTITNRFQPGIVSALFGYVDMLLFRLQLLFMRERTTEVVEPQQARFHPNDARKWVLREYKKRLMRCGIRAERML